MDYDQLYWGCESKLMECVCVCVCVWVCVRAYGGGGY